MPVPTIVQVIPGATVSIVLKADQRTGRQVQGTVQDLLTRGNHPRGIKVRLSDGRIGRVQNMATTTTIATTSTAASLAPETQQAAQSSEIQRDLAIQQRVRGPDRGEAGGGYRSERFQNRYTDFRNDEATEQPPEQLDLMAFVRQPKQKKRVAKASKAAETVDESVEIPLAAAQVATCPVCGEFEGDEAAVAHHVEGHFS